MFNSFTARKTCFKECSNKCKKGSDNGVCSILKKCAEFRQSNLQEIVSIPVFGTESHKSEVPCDYLSSVIPRKVWSNKGCYFQLQGNFRNLSRCFLQKAKKGNGFKDCYKKYWKAIAKDIDGQCKKEIQSESKKKCYNAMNIQL